ncbi:hypothetical protein GCM10010402_77320 [Actinomadura luteofluorescens]|uniref:Rv1733c family protein n=1 Tax=Actinomadura luteofluorescens TaxID=46163 RepID=UPI0021640141|nr:hypothetical protein [Actinomadura glauciflava]MCR3744263.1 hypothetical protein [Actinomadura glauciflava]
MRRLGRVRRRFGFDRNDLRRAVDRRQWAVGVAAAVLFTVLAPPASVLLAVDAYRSGVRAEHRNVHRVTAQVVHTDSQGGPGVRHTYAELAWTSPDGRTRTTVVPADKSVRPGMEQRVWVDAAGDPVQHPQTRTATLATTTVAAATAALAVGVPLLAAYLLARRRCDRRRDALWDESWTSLAQHA